MDEARQYVTICFCGIFFICGYNAISALLRGYGDSRRPMYFVALSCALNIAGDIIFVKYLGLGVAGTALATVLSQSISMICSIVYLNRKKFISVSYTHLDVYKRQNIYSAVFLIIKSSYVLFH